MNFSFLFYLISYLTKAKSRQHLLLFSLMGPLLASFSLLVVQSTMGGLQNKLILRSKAIIGDVLFSLDDDQKMLELGPLWQYAFDKKIAVIPEIELEVLLKNGPYMAPGIVHGLPPSLPALLRPASLKNQSIKNLILGHDLAYKLRAKIGSQIQIISPLKTDLSFEEVPRFVTEVVDELVLTDVPEVDIIALWSRDSLFWNLNKEKKYNKLRVYLRGQNISIAEIKSDLADLGYVIQHTLTWEDQNNALSAALKLESRVMLFLFSCISLLVTLSMASGFILFFNKINLDLVAIWILGMSKKMILKNIIILVLLMIIFSIVLGISLGTLFLMLLKGQGGEILPSLFIDRKIPVVFVYEHYLSALFIPFFIATSLIPLFIKQFKDNQRFVEAIRGRS